MTTPELSLDQVEATCEWFDEQDARSKADRIRQDEEEQMTQQELQEATDDYSDR